MKKLFVPIVFFVLAIFAGMFNVGDVLAEKGARSTAADAPASGDVPSLFVEDFNYVPGTLLTANGWTNHSGTANFIPVSTPGLNFTGYPSSGSAASMTTSGEDVNKPFASQTSGTVYAAFLVQFSLAQLTGDYFFHLAESPIGGNIFRGRVYAKDGGAGTVFIGISKAANNSVPANIAYPATAVPLHTTHVVVVKYTFVEGPANDTVDLFINPDLAAPEPAPSASAPDVTATDLANASLVALRQGTAAAASTQRIDGIRVAKTFADLRSGPRAKSLDYNGDGRSDYAVTRPTGGLKTWYIANTGTSETLGVQWGLEFDNDIAVDFDGDSRTDIAVWREGTAPGGSGDPNRAYFYILQSSTGTLRQEQFGSDGDNPKVAGDYDGDGRADPAVYRQNGPSSGLCGPFKGEYYYRPSATPSTDFIGVCWGTNGDDNNSGDFDGDGKYDFVVRRSQGAAAVFYLKRSSDGGEEAIYWGTPDDTIVPGDFDGDGRNDFAVARINGTNGEVYILERDGGGTPNSPIIFGNVAKGVTGLACADYDGDGRTDVGIGQSDPDPAENYFIIRRSSDGVFTFFEWGQQGDEPVAQWNVDG